MNLTKFTPVELLLLLAMSMLGLLSVVIEIAHSAGTVITATADVASFPLFRQHLALFLPIITTSSYNHIMIVASTILTLLGLIAFLNGNVKVRKTWIYSQVPYWSAQFLAFVVIGVYPIAGICIGLYLGASIYLALNQSLAGS